ncbi:JAB domain-containing protein [Allosphingosinicella flava]|uniref:JAB domain-containing protein n=1 Tax=Allosphingosinicella flava TaxID=2771430 RepID=A0A7T2LM09_9SPHN|nr:JAB domain-containing protein [Sphingosinicella flava]QPQ55014.1 JAB domain-containing protein [Sphingosinicella flava]
MDLFGVETWQEDAMVDVADADLKILTARDAADLFAPILANCASEKLIVAHLDGEGRVLGFSETAGMEDRVDLPIRDIVRDALSVEAHAIILAHNHPSGDPRPSARDKDSTRRLAEVASAIGVALRDHLIFADGGCRSLRAMGLI